MVFRKGLIGVLSLGLSSLAYGSFDKLTPQLKSVLQKQGKVDVVVYLKTKADLQAAYQIKDRVQRIQYVYDQLRNVAKQTQAKMRQKLKKRSYTFRSFYIENAIAVSQADQKLLFELTSLSEVQTIALNVPVKLTIPRVPVLEFAAKKLQEAAGSSSIPEHLKLIGVDRVWSELKVQGANIVVAGQDTGFYWQHNAIKKQYRGYQKGTVNHNYHWHDAIHGIGSASCRGDHPSPCDDRGHGTHTMGTMVGYDGGKNQIGVAPKAKWIGCRNMSQGVGTVASYLECFEFFMAPYPFGSDPQTEGKPSLAPHIVNNSWVCSQKEGCTGNEFFQAVQAMKAAGIMVVAASGNEGPGCGSVTDPPGTYAGDLISVGAYNRFGRNIAFFSSIGPSRWQKRLAPNLVAPGGYVRSAIHTGPNQYEAKGGTSMASPHVAGVVALMWSAQPKLIGDIKQTLAILQNSAQALRSNKSCEPFPGGATPNAVFGYGLVDAYAAVKKAIALK